MESESCLIYVIQIPYNKPTSTVVFQSTCQLNRHISSTIATTIHDFLGLHVILLNTVKLKYTGGDPQEQTHTGKSKTMETYPHGAIERHGNKSM